MALKRETGVKFGPERDIGRRNNIAFTATEKGVQAGREGKGKEHAMRTLSTILMAPIVEV